MFMQPNSLLLHLKWATLSRSVEKSPSSTVPQVRRFVAAGLLCIQLLQILIIIGVTKI